MKILVNILILLCIGQYVCAQITDTLPPEDINSIKTENLPVFADTLHYNDTIIKNTTAGRDTIIVKKVHSPKKATIYSAVLPGLGQVYNKKYWKVPIVYAAIGIPTGLFFYNKKYYNASRYALSIVANNRFANADSMAKVDPQLKPLVQPGFDNSIINYRNQFRRDMDYSVLVTLLMWGLNIVDATVDGHLKGFDVSDDLTLKIQPAIIPGTMVPGVLFVVNFK